MIHISVRNKRPSNTWLNKAERHTNAILAKRSLKEKKAYIDTTPSIWTELRPFFEKLSNHKCWYSEASESVSLYDVDHFRPKKEIRKIQCSFKYNECQRISWKEGYWWLSYDWNNYRLSGQIPNRCFKRNYFPLKYGTTIAIRPKDKYKKIEKPLLIDPTIKSDVRLLTFDINGKAIAVFSQLQDSWKYTRAVISIELFGLNEGKLVRSRQKVIVKCKKAVDRANRKYNLMKAMPNKKSHQYKEYALDFADFVSDLKEYISSEADFSATAIAYIKSFNYKWINKYVFK